MKIVKIASLLSLGLLTSGCVISINAHDEDRDRQAQTRDVMGDFDKLVVNGSVRVDVQVGAEASIVVMGDSHSVYDTKTLINDGTLIVDRVSSRGDRPRVRITTPSLTSLTSGSRIEAHVSGLNAETWTLTTSGRGNVYLSGNCGEANYTLSGRTDVHADNLTCNTVNIMHSGRGDLEVYAGEMVNITQSGKGDVSIMGSAQIGQRMVSGEGRLILK